MAALAETRDLGSSLALPSDVRRICCIGDSVTYGQGVAPRHTLAMHIARFANMAYPDQLVWVDNRGQSSGNIWHAWVPFARLAEILRYDAAILSLCHNDAQIFESNSVQYADVDSRSWLREGSLAPLLRRTIADLARTAAERKLCLIIDFYTLWDKDAPLVEAVRRECESAGLPFVDLLRFLKDESGLSVAEFSASPFDGHPSDSGHRAAARRVVEELTVQWWPPEAEGAPVADRLVAACDQAIRDGWAVDDILNWASEVLDAKQTVERRQRARGGAVAFGDLVGARAAIEQRYQRWYAGRIAAVQARLLHDRVDKPSALLETAYASIRNLDEMSFVLQRLGDGADATELWALLEGGGYFTQAKRLHDLPADLRALLVGLADHAASLPAIDHGPFGLSFAGLRRDFEGNLRTLAALLPETLDSSRLDLPSTRLWQVARYLAEAAWVYVRQFAEATGQLASRLPRKPVFFTTVDVRVERDGRRPKRGGVFNLTVEMDYMEPLRGRRSEKLWAGADEDIHIYRFELPMLLLGDVGIGVPGWDGMHKLFLDGELRLARVEIGNFAPDAQRTYRPIVWLPPQGAKPVHWVKFERLSLLGQEGGEVKGVGPSASAKTRMMSLRDKMRRLWG